jgi:hypothetical protein
MPKENKSTDDRRDSPRPAEVKDVKAEHARDEERLSEELDLDLGSDLRSGSDEFGIEER